MTVVSLPDQNEARLAVVESKVADLANDNARIEALMIDGQRRLEAKVDQLLADSVPVGVARQMARMQTVAGMSGTALVGALLHIAINL